MTIKNLVIALATVAIILGTPFVATATQFTLSEFWVDAYDPANSVDGLEIDWRLAQDFILEKTFDLEVDQTISFDLFDIWTPESDVAWGEDTRRKNITANFVFSEPFFSGQVGGNTFGVSLFGSVEWGKVVWNNPTIFSFGDNPEGYLAVHLSNETFNEGFLGLNGGVNYGCTVNAKFKLLQEAGEVTDLNTAGLSVPDASIMFLLGPALIGLGILGRRKRPQ